MQRSAFYETDITPPLGCTIPGYFNVRYGSNVKDKLYAKAVVMDDGVNTIAILAIDACSITKETHDIITERIEESIGLKPENVMMCATHTHTGGPGEAVVKNDELYVDMMRRQAADCVILAYKRLNPSVVKYSNGKVDSISFNRNYIMKDGTVRTNPGRKNPDIVKPYAGIDPELSILYFEDEKGAPMGAIVNFACHQDCVDGTEYSGDFSSVVSKELKSIYGENFVSLFVAGACGNINHFDVSREYDDPDHYVKMGKILSEEAVKTIEEAKEINFGVCSKKEYIKINRRVIEEKAVQEAKKIIKTTKELKGVKLASDAEPEQFNLAMAKMLIKYCEDTSKTCDVTVQVLRVGDCIIYALPGEVFMQFGQYIKENSPTRNNIVATLCNGNNGYIPTRELFLPFVYEALSYYLEPEGGYIISEKAIELAKECFN